MRFFVLMLALFTVAACAPEINTQYINAMNGYIGKSERVLINSMGVPDKTYQVENGPKLVTYTRESQREVGGGFGMSGCMGRYDRFAYGSCIGQPPARIYTFSCDLTFTLQKGRVTNWSQRGNDCPRVQ